MTVGNNSSSPPLYLGLDLSTQSVTAVLVEAPPSLRVVDVQRVVFDDDLPKYATKNGMHVAPQGGRVTSPVMMWLEALDRLFAKLDRGLLARVVAVSGSAQQHGSVYWNREGAERVRCMDSGKSLACNLIGGFSMDECPIWADSSTQVGGGGGPHSDGMHGSHGGWMPCVALCVLLLLLQFECDSLEGAVEGGAAQVAKVTGSRAYCRFTGPQIARIARTRPGVYAATERISLVSSFLSSLLVGRVAPIDVSDGSGMNLLDLWTHQWAEDLLHATAPDLARRLGRSLVAPYEALGPVSPYVSCRLGLRPDCLVVPCSGDNNNSIVGMGLEAEGDVVVSLGTSDTLIGLTRTPRPGLEGHVMASPRGPGEWFAMLCYKNGALAREAVRDQACQGDWDRFSRCLRESQPGNGGVLGLWLCLEEIIPLLPYRGTFRQDAQGKLLPPNQRFDSEAMEVRAVVESRFLSMAVHAQAVGIAFPPRRVLATGGGAQNKEMMQVRRP